MSESKKQNPDGFREMLLKERRAFVTYRLPGSGDPTIMTGSAGIRGINDAESMVTGKPGFLMAGFSPHTPTLWLEADSINTYTIKSEVPDLRFTKDTPVLSASPFLEITRKEYLGQVKEITGLLKKGVAGKVVLSRVLAAPLKNPLIAPMLFDLLCSSHTNAFVYLAYFPSYGLWVGATPETLLSYRQRKVTTMALAGTRIAGNEDVWSEKDAREHAFVADFIQEKLEQSGCSSIIRSLTYTTNAGIVDHLRTDFSADCSAARVAPLIQQLHPTPAVCGWPADSALNIISRTEKHSRSYYSGYLGPTGNETAGLFVNLRCMQLLADKALIYVGGGLTADSVPEAEWDETVLKSRTMLAAIEKIRNLALW